MSTDLHKRMLAFDYHDDERSQLMRSVWAPTPFMVDAYSGGSGEARERDMLAWCYESFGQQASPIHDRPGRWQRGSATVFGWTWFGFSAQAELDAFTAAWPAPDGFEAPGP